MQSQNITSTESRMVWDHLITQKGYICYFHLVIDKNSLIAVCSFEKKW